MEKFWKLFSSNLNLISYFSILIVCIVIPLPVFAEDLQPQVIDKLSLNSLWVVIAACIVFMMQFGFLAFEIGAVREKNTVVMAVKNVGDWLIVSVVFYFVGFGLMFGHTSSGIFHGYFGTDFFFLKGMDTEAVDVNPLRWSFFMFQLAFAGTAATIVSGSTAERLGFKAYLVFCVAMGAIIYPIFGHWVWGGGFILGQKPYLADMGFIDFAGASVCHQVGAWSSLIAIWMLGPRIGRFASDGSVVELETNSKLWSCIGIMILWFGWWGFNGGSLFEVNSSLGKVIFNTNLAAAAGGLVAFAHSAIYQKHRNAVEKLVGGILGGLVAITACANLVDPSSALVIGALAGYIHNKTFDWMIYNWGLDDVVFAVPAHGFCGLWGILCVALFGKAELLPRPWLDQLIIQVIGSIICFTWTSLTTLLVFWILKRTIGIRVSSMLEITGLTIDEQEPDFGDDQLEDDEDLLLPELRSNSLTRSDLGNYNI